MRLAILDDVCLCVWTFVHLVTVLSSLGESAIERLRPWHVILAHPFTKDPHHTVFLGIPPLRYDVLAVIDVYGTTL